MLFVPVAGAAVARTSPYAPTLPGPNIAALHSTNTSEGNRNTPVAILYGGTAHLSFTRDLMPE